MFSEWDAHNRSKKYFFSFQFLNTVHLVRKKKTFPNNCYYIRILKKKTPFNGRLYLISSKSFWMPIILHIIFGNFARNNLEFLMWEFYEEFHGKMISLMVWKKVFLFADCCRIVSYFTPSHWRVNSSCIKLCWSIYVFVSFSRGMAVPLMQCPCYQ